MYMCVCMYTCGYIGVRRPVRLPPGALGDDGDLPAGRQAELLIHKYSIYIYIYIERERDTHICIYIYIIVYVYIYIYIYIYTHTYTHTLAILYTCVYITTDCTVKTI